jgi:hypothetical protein
MGQLNFFMTQEEIYKEVKHLIDSDSFLLFDGFSSISEIPIPITEPNHIENFQQLIIWIKNTIIQPKCSQKGKGEYSNHFLFDYYYDPIIEFEIERIQDNLISPSRLFYKTGWIKNRELRECHAKQTNKIIRQFKKGLHIFENTKPFYVSNGVIDLLDQNYEIELGNGGLRLNKTDMTHVYIR